MEDGAQQSGRAAAEVVLLLAERALMQVADGTPTRQSARPKQPRFGLCGGLIGCVALPR